MIASGVHVGMHAQTFYDTQQTAIKTKKKKRGEHTMYRYHGTGLLAARVMTKTFRFVPEAYGDRLRPEWRVLMSSTDHFPKPRGTISGQQPRQEGKKTSALQRVTAPKQA